VTAVLVLRWFLDGTRMAQLAVDNGISGPTGYSYLHEGIDVLASRAPNLESALLAAKMAGYTPCQHRRHADRDRPLPHTWPYEGCGPVVVGKACQPWREHTGHHRSRRLAAVDIQRAPGREHDTTALREHLEILPALATWIAANRPALGDLGYEGEAGTITVAFKKPKDGQLTDAQKAHNKAHKGKRAVGERGNSLLKMTFKALRNISLCPWRIGKIVAAALVLLHADHDRTT
jgi:DDE superfamily endonuclease